MQLIFIYGQVASGKLTVARALAAQTGLPVFHNHLIVDAVASVFPFGSEQFVRLRERFWLEIIGTAARTSTSMIFTFAPEPTVAPDFPRQVSEIVTAANGRVIFVALTLAVEIQERRLVEPGRAEFGKLRSLDLLRQMQTDFNACMDAMPDARVRIDSGNTPPSDAAAMIVEAMTA
jgi:hypothetical protein